MDDKEYYEYAKKKYAEFGIDTDEAIEKLMNVPVSLHCWQGDDVRGFDTNGTLDGGIQTTGNYPGAARNPSELMSDIEEALKLMPGKMRLNLHSNYAIPKDHTFADRDELKPEHFSEWVKFAKEKGIALDFNPTFFSHPMLRDGLTLSSPRKQVRDFWIRHGICCIRIAEYFARELGKKCLINFWMPDGYKETPADRIGPRMRMTESLEAILSAGYDKNLIDISLESKVFGIGVESYTVVSAEFCTEFASRHGLVPLFDNGHYHPTEMVADKISTALLFNKRIALHVTRGVRWDSDHVCRFNDEIREIALEIVRCGGLDRAYLALDYFDASINRIAAWVTGLRAFKQALLFALCWPHTEATVAQNNADFTDMLVISEQIKTAPFSAVWSEFCRRAEVPLDYLGEIKKYEKDVLFKRK